MKKKIKKIELHRDGRSGGGRIVGRSAAAADDSER